MLVACAWCAPLTIIVALIGLLIARVLPLPLGPDSPPGEVVSFYSGGSHVTFGFVLSSLGFALLVPLAAGISAVMRTDSTPAGRLLAGMQLVAGTYTAVTTTLAMIMMSAIALRPRDPSIAVMVNDLAWLVFTMPVGVFIVQDVAIGVYTLSSATAIFPRWYGYLCLWVGFTFYFDVLGRIYARRPYGWKRPLIFWLALSAFPVFLLSTGYLIRRHALGPSLARTAPGEADLVEARGSMAIEVRAR